MGALYLRPTPASAWSARRAVAFELLPLGLSPDILDEVAVILTELVSNALIHARPVASGHIYVSWAISDDSIRLSVRDGGAESVPSARVPGPAEETGRGLVLVAALADAWGVTASVLGQSSVWASKSFIRGRVNTSVIGR
jgi:serine/threonine-protein kinase RsbW